MDCGVTFDEPRPVYEPHGEVTYCCPVCGGDFANAIYCDLCGEPVTGDYIVTKDKQTICDECFIKKNINENWVEDAI